MDDLFAAWSYGGSNVLTTRRSNGSAFILQPNTMGQGTWDASAQWCGGRGGKRAGPRAVGPPGVLRCGTGR